MTNYRNRRDAGRRLIPLLQKYRSARPVVMGLLRGGIEVAAEIAEALDAPLDVLVVRKIGLPGFPEVAVGAVGDGATWLNEALIADLNVSRDALQRLTDIETKEVARREMAFRDGRPAVPLAGRTVILVDDGLATGATAITGLRILRQQHPARLVFAVPVCSVEGAERVAQEADEVICAERPHGFFAVSGAYDAFPQLRDAEVKACLAAAGKDRPRRVVA